MICVTLFCTFKSQHARIARVSRAILAYPCFFFLTQRAKTCYKIWYIGPLLRYTIRFRWHFQNIQHMDGKLDFFNRCSHLGPSPIIPWQGIFITVCSRISWSPSNRWSLIVKGSVHASIKALAFRSVWGMRVETTHCLPQQHLQWTWTSERIQAPHYLIRDIWAVKIFTTRWSGGSLPTGRIPVWVQVWAPDGHLAITPEGHSRGNQWPALWAALQHRLNGSKLGLTNTNTGRFRVSDSCCWQGPAHLRKSATTLAILT